MPKTLALDENDDLDVSGGTLHILEGGDAIAQDVRSALRTVLGEWFLGRQSVGTDYLGEVFRHAPTVAGIVAMFRTKILSRPGVLGIISRVGTDPGDGIELDTSTLGVDRKLRVRFEIETVEGRVAVDDVIGL